MFFRPARAVFASFRQVRRNDSDHYDVARFAVANCTHGIPLAAHAASLHLYRRLLHICRSVGKAAALENTQSARLLPSGPVLAERCASRPIPAAN